MVNRTQKVQDIQEKYKIIGRTEELRQIALAHSVGKNILIEGEVGVGKTTLAKAIASFFDSEFYRVDCSVLCFRCCISFICSCKRPV